MTESQPQMPAAPERTVRSVVQERRAKMDAWLAGAKEKVAKFGRGAAEFGLNTVAVIAESGTLLEMGNNWRERVIAELPGKVSAARESVTSAVTNFSKETAASARAAITSSREFLARKTQEVVDAPGNWYRSIELYCENAHNQARLKEAKRMADKVGNEQLPELLAAIQSKMGLLDTVPMAANMNSAETVAA